MKRIILLAVALLSAAFVSAQVVVPDVAATTTVGHQATLTVTADSLDSTGAVAPMTIQWNKNSVAISGATATPFILKNLQLTDSAVYTASLTNKGGTIISPKMTLTVNAAAIAPTITTQPKAQAVIAGGSATFSVVAAGTGPLTYQWMKDGAPWPFPNASATTATFTNPNLDATDAGTYTCVVTGPGGTVTSGGAALVVFTVNLPVVRSVGVTFQ